jgi:hypothetical protein
MKTKNIYSVLFAGLILIIAISFGCVKKKKTDGVVKLGYKNDPQSTTSGAATTGSTTSSSTSSSTTSTTTTTSNTTSSTTASAATPAGQLFIQGVGKGLSITSSTGNPMEITALTNDGKETVYIKFNVAIPPAGTYTLISASPGPSDFTMKYSFSNGTNIFNYSAPTPNPSRALVLTYSVTNKPQIVIQAAAPIIVNTPVPSAGAPFTSRTIYGKINVL